MDNFVCKECETKFHEPTYTVGFVKGGDAVYRNKFNQKLSCPKCGSENIGSIEREGGGVPYFGRFSSSSPDVKREILKKRARDNDQKFKEQRTHIDKNFDGKIKKGDY